MDKILVEVIEWLEKILCTHDHIIKVGYYDGSFEYKCYYCNMKINSKYVNQGNTASKGG